MNRSTEQNSLTVDGEWSELNSELALNKDLQQIMIKRNVSLSYITVLTAVHDERGILTDILISRPEPASAGDSEMIDFTNESTSQGVKIPNKGIVKVFVWHGSFVDGSMNMKPLSDVRIIQNP